ncbi:ComEC/Rec2 family competence protein [Candidatus Nomurabacteria bacterium]|nr:ComEC/Rec2 family competence protein [Candidatus Nomurabacteria bacterium]
MGKSKIFLSISLLFLLLVFILDLWKPSLFSDLDFNQDNFSFDQFYQFQAKVVNLDKKLDAWQLVVQPKDLAFFQGQIIVYAPLYPEYQYGDILELSCKIYQPEKIVNENGQKFFYDQYLAKDDIYGQCFRPKIKLIGQQKDWRTIFFISKKYFWQNLNDYLPEPASSLAKAMLLAARRELPDELRNTFSAAGLSHVVAISGLHIAIIVWILQAFLYLLGCSRQQVFYLTILILAAYLFLLGFPSSALRASLMVFFVLLGPFIGRQSQSINSLLLAALILLIFNPLLLVYDIGFQLSFLAVLGLLFYVSWWQKVLFFIPNFFKVREMISVTLAAQMFTWPLIIYYFHIFSLVAPVVNILVLPLLPAVLAMSILLALSGFWTILANVFAWPLFILLKIIVSLAQFSVQVPFAYLNFDHFDLLALIFSFLMIFILTLILKPQNEKNN